MLARRMALRPWASSVAVCVLAVLVLTAAVSAAQKPPPIKVGFVVSFSGTYAALAQDQWRGAQLAAKQINAEGGVLGRELVLIPRDEKLDPGEAARVTQELIQSENVDFVVGSMSAATGPAINQVTKRAGVPYIGIAQSDRLTNANERGPYTFHEALTPSMDGIAFGDWILSNLGTRVFFLMPDYAFGQEHYDAFKVALDKRGIKEAGSIWFPLGTTDFTPYMPRIRAAQPEVVVTAALGNDQVNLLKQVQAFGLTRNIKWFFAVVDLQGDAAAGFENVQNTYGGMSFYWELADSVPSAKRFVDAFRAEYGLPPSGYAGYAYSAIHAMRLAAEKAGTIEPKAWARAMAGMRYDTYKGQQWYRECDGQSIQPMFIVRGRTRSEARALGREDYGFRQVIATIQPYEGMERSCKDRGY